MPASWRPHMHHFDGFLSSLWLLSTSSSKSLGPTSNLLQKFERIERWSHSKLASLLSLILAYIFHISFAVTSGRRYCGADWFPQYPWVSWLLFICSDGTNGILPMHFVFYLTLLQSIYVTSFTQLFEAFPLLLRVTPFRLPRMHSSLSRLLVWQYCVSFWIVSKAVLHDL